MTDSPTEELLINKHVSIFNTLVLIFSLCLRVKCSLHQGNASPGFIIMTYSESLVIRLREAEYVSFHPIWVTAWLLSLRANRFYILLIDWPDHLNCTVE